RDLNKKNPDKNYWAIGVDSDQTAEGVVDVDGAQHNVIITSALKRVDNAVKDLSTKAANGEFPGGEIITYGLDVDGVGLAPINEELENKADIEAKVEEFKQKIVSGEIVVPAARADVK
ncbi:MAG TPA: BMP family ABC transporter substrate-binding protein, partial [Pseudoneobacillus sp.]|nr:BMP family ABC transporter substrate-binding protein [Pseudoneobacillus sp.]